MNVLLNNQLVDAYNIFKKAEAEFGTGIKKANSNILSFKKRIDDNNYRLKHITYPETAKETLRKQYNRFLLASFFIWPAGIPILIYYFLTSKKRERQHNQNYVSQMRVCENYRRELIKKIDDDKQQILNNKNYVDNKKAEMQNFLQKHGDIINFIPKPYRTLEIVERLYFFIHEEYSFTLNDAIRRYEAERSELIALRESIEARENEERKHRELQKAINEMTYYQKQSADEQRRTNDILNRIQ